MRRDRTRLPGLRAGLLGGVVLAGTLMAGCGGGPDEEGASADLQGLADDVMAQGRELVEALEGAGLSVQEAGGEGEYCRSEPSPGVTFRFGGRVVEEGAYAEQFEVARAALEADGWELDTSGQTPTPWANFTRGDHEAGLSQTALQGSEALTFGVETPECIDVPDGGFVIPDNLKRVPAAPAD